MTGETRTGGCLCGQIRYRAPQRPLNVAVCHCRDCQKQAGSALSILAVFPRDAVQIDGKPSVYEGTGESGGKVQRVFCGNCGSPIYSDSPAMAQRGIIAIKAGTLDEVGDLQPTIQYWARSRQPWLPLVEGLACRETE